MNMGIESYRNLGLKFNWDDGADQSRNEEKEIKEEIKIPKIWENLEKGGNSAKTFYREMAISKKH